MKRHVLLSLALLVWSSLALAHDGAHEERLPVIGSAPGFTLTSQTRKSVSLGDFRGKTVVVTFIYASCTDTCPLLTDNLSPPSAQKPYIREDHFSGGRPKTSTGI